MPVNDKIDHDRELTGTNVSGVKIPTIALGTWPLTGEDCASAVSHAVEMGYRHIDTAENYANESSVGEGIQRGCKISGLNREDLFVTTKINKENHGDLKHVRSAVEQRLADLNLDYIDLLLIHWPNPGQERYVETAHALADLVPEGLIRSWGVSNFKPAHLSALAESGLHAPINQIQVDPTASQPQVQEANRAHGALTSAYSPFGRDIDLTGFSALTQPAQRLGLNEHQVALLWHVQQGRVVVPRSANPARQAENLNSVQGASGILTDDELAGIDALDTGAGPRMDSDEFGH